MDTKRTGFNGSMGWINDEERGHDLWILEMAFERISARSTVFLFIDTLAFVQIISIS